MTHYSFHFSNNSRKSGIQIAFGDSQIMETTNYVTYKIQNFVSDIGGLAGLFLGFSLLSLFELILKVFAGIRSFIRKSPSVKVDKSISRKSRKHKANRIQRSRGNVNQVKSVPDVVVIDLLFGEQVEATIIPQ